jgi:hypothetical protein
MNARSATPCRLLPVVLALLGLAGCQERTTDGGTTDGTSTVAFYLPDGKPAAGARVQIFASSDTTRTPRIQAFTDANGEVELPVLDSSYYNLVARDKSGRAMFQDSLLSNGKSMDYASDTLVATGVVTGRVKVQPQHDPRIVWIALLGAGTYLNVDDSGRFRIEGVPEGKFTLAGFTKEIGYTTTFSALRVRRDSTSDIGTLDMVFTGLPVATGVEASWTPGSWTVSVRWDSPSSPKVKGWKVLRSFGIWASEAVPVGVVSDPSKTEFVDSLVGPDRLWEPQDTVEAILRYWVVPLDAVGKPGEAWNGDSVRYQTPGRERLLDLQWRKVGLGSTGFENDRIDTLGGGFLLSQSRYEGGDTTTIRFLHSPDGETWTSLGSFPSEIASTLYGFGVRQGVSFGGAYWWVEAAGNARTLREDAAEIGILRDSAILHRLDAAGSREVERFAVHDSAGHVFLATDGRGLFALHASMGNMGVVSRRVWQRDRVGSDFVRRRDTLAASWIPNWENTEMGVSTAFPSKVGDPWIQKPLPSWQTPNASFGRGSFFSEGPPVQAVLEIEGRLLLRESFYLNHPGRLTWADSAAPSTRWLVRSPSGIRGLASNGSEFFVLADSGLFRAPTPPQWGAPNGSLR